MPQRYSVFIFRGHTVQPQAGVVKPPGKYSLIRIYTFEDLPLLTMNVARIGAQTPALAGAMGGGKLMATVGFGPMAWTLITPDAPAPGFRSFDDAEVDGETIPETEGDFLLYVSSDQDEMNRALAEQVEAEFGREAELIEEVIVEGGEFADLEGSRVENLIPHSSNPDAAQSGFVLTERYGLAVPDAERSRHLFVCADGQARFSMTFSNRPGLLDREVSPVPVSRGLFFLPSLELLTSLRMGGIRMGSLAINAKWKE